MTNELCIYLFRTSDGHPPSFGVSSVSGSQTQRAMLSVDFGEVSGPSKTPGSTIAAAFRSARRHE
ncbi:hypothetical protein SPRG_02542 [Saprolegnia parasitica CBS 223.65]|uniref:Uncharacterized protein n=1 Tax=Saprolegnia parasitica (strain CBS 223.65) TaxID=695850 RepID=A0A067CQ80_SAPPC|nr:hypothetical protein SPRG_02542 [Saprolegnia parasitica CBS 223.65]KDO32849.1 hypothetical protein SPRG_02542 [Saprolegnia parasitica CBS 223.65]|eukprot:XP_012196503.1 hypothetical protein SPRG_02542 [Saprolegnia parasitica CBS 223.65]